MLCNKIGEAYIVYKSEHGIQFDKFNFQVS